MSKITIGKLIVETLNGNSSAESELYLIYRKKLDSFLLNKYGDRNDHSDDVSEILIKIFENLKKYDETKSKFDTWVFMIAKNYMIDKSRKMKPIYVSFSSNTFNCDDTISSTYSRNNQDNGTFTTTNKGTLNMLEPESYLSSPYEILETSDSLNYISTTIGIENFLMLTMKYNDGYSYNEIAQEFSSNESKISNKVNYSKSKIKKGEE